LERTLRVRAFRVWLRALATVDEGLRGAFILVDTRDVETLVCDGGHVAGATDALKVARGVGASRVSISCTPTGVGLRARLQEATTREEVVVLRRIIRKNFFLDISEEGKSLGRSG
jgi:hypothetical protein